MREKDPIELHQSEDGKNSFEYSKKQKLSFGPKWIMWSSLIGGIAIGTFLFLSFLTFFVYLFLPIILISMLWGIYRLWRFRRM